MTFESYFMLTPSTLGWRSAGFTAECLPEEYLSFLKTRMEPSLHHIEWESGCPCCETRNLITLFFANTIGTITHRDEILFDTEEEANTFVGLLPEPTDQPEEA